MPIIIICLTGKRRNKDAFEEIAEQFTKASGFLVKRRRGACKRMGLVTNGTLSSQTEIPRIPNRNFPKCFVNGKHPRMIPCGNFWPRPSSPFLSIDLLKENFSSLYYEGLLRTKYRICIHPCYVAYMNAMRNKSISRHVRYKLKVSDKTKRCPTQVKDVR